MNNNDDMMQYEYSSCNNNSNNSSSFLQIWRNVYLNNSILASLKTCSVSKDIRNMTYTNYADRPNVVIRDRQERNYYGVAKAKVVKHFNDPSMTADWISENRYFHLLYDKLLYSMKNRDSVVFRLSFSSIARLLMYSNDFDLFYKIYDLVPDMFYHTNRNRYHVAKYRVRKPLVQGNGFGSDDHEEDDLYNRYGDSNNSNNSKKKRIKENHLKKGKGRETIVDLACRGGNIRIVEYLIGKGYFPTHKSMLFAIDSGHLDLVLYLSTKTNIDVTTDAMDLAIKHCWKEIVFYLAENRNEGCTGATLYYACERNDWELVQYLYRYKPEIFNENKRALLAAAKKGHLELVTFFIESNLVSHESTRDSLILDFALSSGNSELVRYLQTKVGSLKISSKWIQFCASNGHLDIIKQNIKPEHLDDPCIVTAISYALRNGHCNIFNYFYEKSPSFESRKIASLLMTPFKKIVQNQDTQTIINVYRVCGTQEYILYNLNETLLSYGQLETIQIVLKEINALSTKLYPGPQIAPSVLQYIIENGFKFDFAFFLLKFLNTGNLEAIKVLTSYGHRVVETVSERESVLVLSNFSVLEYMINSQQFQQKPNLPNRVYYMLNNPSNQRLNYKIVVEADPDLDQAIKQFYFCKQRNMRVNYLQYIIIALTENNMTLLQDIGDCNPDNEWEKLFIERALNRANNIAFAPCPHLFVKCPFIYLYHLYQFNLLLREDLTGALDSCQSFHCLRFLYYNFSNLPFSPNIITNNVHRENIEKHLTFISHHITNQIPCSILESLLADRFRRGSSLVIKLFDAVESETDPKPASPSKIINLYLEAEKKQSIKQLLEFQKKYRFIPDDYRVLFNAQTSFNSLDDLDWTRFHPMSDNDIFYQYLSDRFPIRNLYCNGCKQYCYFFNHKCKSKDGSKRFMYALIQILLDLIGQHQHAVPRGPGKIYDDACACIDALDANPRHRITFGPNKSLTLYLNHKVIPPALVLDDSQRASSWIFYESLDKNKTIPSNISTAHSNTNFINMSMDPLNNSLYLPHLPDISVMGLIVISFIQAYLTKRKE
ncbi:hypothetical protein CYY_002349 [Polysphondylium violaceum]|uniref:Ankyrin repeat-containing protein n=1 Tax=Polysphondylium violaceum TaxID=133409 RepID=A0A8J4PY78_9MYCE|nr:hypothetical protein CYY_002349 [Polysphondylium violaceum]